MSDTPRTDAALEEHYKDSYGAYVDVEFARTLERELAQAQADLAAARLDAERYKGALDTAAWMLERWEGAFASSAPTLSHETINFLLSLSAYAARVQERSDGKE